MSDEDLGDWYFEEVKSRLEANQKLLEMILVSRPKLDEMLAKEEKK